MSEVGTLVLLRHGESEWNAKNLFTGWVDVDLTAKGEAEAAPRRRAARASTACCPTSCTRRVLRRAIRTAELALDAADRHWIPVRAVVAAQRAALRRAAGQGQEADPRGVRRGAVHALAPLLRHAAAADRRRRRVRRRSATRATPTLPPELRPRTECLKDVVARMLPYWYDAIVPDLLRRPDGAGRRARQLAAGAGQAPRRHLRRGDRRRSTSRPASRCATTSTTTLRPITAGRHLPRPGGGQGGRRRGRQPGPVVSEGGRRAGPLAVRCQPAWSTVSPVTRNTTCRPALTAWSA